MTAPVLTHPTAGNEPIGPQRRPHGRPHANIVTLGRARKRAKVAAEQRGDDLCIAAEALMEQAYQLFDSALAFRDQVAARHGLRRLDDGDAA